MSTPRIVRARQLAAALTGLGIHTTADVGQLAGMLPAVLITPPRLTFDLDDAATATWRLLAVAGTTDEHDAWQQLDTLVTQLADSGLPFETAEPTAFARSGATDPLPAYALTFTDTVES